MKYIFKSLTFLPFKGSICRGTDYCFTLMPKYRRDRRVLSFWQIALIKRAAYSVAIP